MVAVTAPGATAAPIDGGAWHLDEVSGSVAVDSSGNGNDGTIRGRAVLGLPGHEGSGYSFASAGSWIEVPSTGSLNPGTSNFSDSAWVSFTEAPES